MLHFLERFFLFNKAQLFLLQRSLFPGNSRFNLDPFVYFGLLLLNLGFGVSSSLGIYNNFWRVK